MRKAVSPVVAAVVIVCAFAIAGFVVWKLNEDRPIPEGPGNGRIGQTYNINPGGKPGPKTGTEKPRQPDKPDAKAGK